MMPAARPNLTSYEIAQGNVAKLTVVLPAAQALTRVEGEQIRDWQITPGTNGLQLLTVEFIKPVEKSYSLVLYSEQTIDSTPSTVELRPPQPLEQKVQLLRDFRSQFDRGADVRRQSQRVNARVMELQVAPEQMTKADLELQ